MTMRYAPLPGPLTLIPSDKLHGQLARLVQEHPTLRLPRGPGELLGVLNSRPDGVAATFSEPKRGGDWSLLLYLPTFTVRLFLTRKYQDAYTVGAVGLMRIHDHQRLAEGCLLIRPSGWRMAFDVQSIPRPSDAYWSPLVAEWRRLAEDLAAERGAPALTEAHAAFLDTVDSMIDADERITTEAAKAAPLFPYRDVGATGERRQGTRQYYRFRLAGGPAPEPRAFVQVHGAPDLRGQVTRVLGDAVTVRFEHPVDWARFAESPQGQLELTSSRVVYEKQREAVALLRSRRARNTTLLPALVAGGGGRLPSAPGSDPSGGLDADQYEALQKGLVTEDVLVVHGPPGTGKTRVITHLAHAARVQRGERVLITSHTNRAVDNVLARLPKDLRAVRVGNDGVVTAEGRPYLLERQIDEVRDRVLGEAGLAADRYERLDGAERWTNELDSGLAKLDAERNEENQARIRLDQARRASGGAAQLRVDALAAERDAHDQALDRLRRLMERRGERIRWTSAHAAMPLLGLLFGWLDALWRRRQEAGAERAGHLREERRLTCGALEAAERELDAATRDVPAVREARAAAHAAARRGEALWPGVRRASREARLAVAKVKAPPPVREDADRQTLDEDVRNLLRWLRANLGPLRARAALLAEWRADVARETEPLSSELVRYADVVAATCIGTASRRELAGIDFDLAIVDEAGQIGVANALVPLCRARRGVLVGDDQQLPPFLDSEVEAWGTTLDDPLVRELLAQSALERLSGGEVVRLTGQRRMPAVIAGFVSTAFYGGRLRTEVRREHRDAVFGGPLAFVDTARLPEIERYERSAGGRGESWGRSGYINRAEALLLVELAVHYDRIGAGWAVIVPYKAQAERIAKDLARRIGDAEKARLNVGTVDSFQGGEREAILYGFTRSNDSGRVGFLKELRRANVAFTRAQFQLVLVGDLTTLTSARDRGFRELATELRAHTSRHGEIRQYRDVLARVKKLNAEEGRA